MCRTFPILEVEEYEGPCTMVQEEKGLPALRKRLVQLPNTLQACPGQQEQKQDKPFDPATCDTPPPSEELPGPSSAQQETENLRKAKSVVITRSRRYQLPGHSYTAVNVKAINRTSENLAQYINHKEDKRLARTLTSIDRERTVFSNSITRDEKILLQRSKALAHVILARPAAPTTPAPARGRHESGEGRVRSVRATSSPVKLRGSSPSRGRQDRNCSPVRSCTVPDMSYLYGEAITTQPARPLKVKLKRSRTANVLRRSAIKRRDEEERPAPRETTADPSPAVPNARLLWANSVNIIMKRDIKTWHKAYLNSTTKCITSTAPTPPPPLTRTPTMPVIPDKASTPVPNDPLDSDNIFKHFSNKDIDKGAWITNYINTSCAEHFPMI